MFKFNRNDELQQTIANQKIQIQKYQTKIRDLVQAYKSLQNEKNALETSMKALTSAHSPQKSSTEDPEENIEKKAKEENETEQGEQREQSLQDSQQHETDESSSSSDSTNSSDNSNEVAHLRSQLITLTKSMSTMSDEKHKIVAAYQAEKKNLKQEHDQQRSAWKAEKSSLQGKMQALEEQAQEMRDRRREDQREREQEHSSNAIMIREIQKMLNEERGKTVAQQEQIKELKAKRKQLKQQQMDRRSEQRQLDETRRKLADAERQLATTPPEVVQLTAELAEEKRARHDEVDRERRRAAEAIRVSEQRSRADEARIGDLEVKVVAVSDKLGASERTRQQDQLVIKKLRDRISQFEDLSSASSNAVVGKHNDESEHTNRNSSTQQQNNDDDYKEAYIALQQQVVEMREEIEKHKTRSLLNSIRGGCDNQVEELKVKLTESREVVTNLRERCRQLQERLGDQAEIQKRQTEEQERRFSKRMAKTREENEARVSEMEREIKSQRDRTVAILLDKDKEIRILQSKLGINTSGSEMDTSAMMMVMGQQHGTAAGGEEPSSSFAKLRSSGSVDLTTTTASSTEDNLNSMLQKTSEVKLLHNAEQLARKDIALNMLRREKKQAEVKLRRVQETLVTSQEESCRRITEVEAKLEEQLRSKSREGANVEYLKNVIYRYLTTRDAPSRQRMAVAIATILEFSPEERRKVGA